MKLIYCSECHDIVRLYTSGRRYCSCGRSAGYYKPDGLNAVISGSAVALGFLNSSFAQALKKNIVTNGTQRHGVRFDAFVIPLKTCQTIEVEEHVIPNCQNQTEKTNNNQ